jgi:multidrug efflux pump
MPTDLAFARDRLVVALIAVLALGGLALLPDYPSQEDPVIPVNEAVVTAFNPGLDLAETEALLARPLERAARAMPESKSSTTTVRAGSVHLRFEIRDGTPDYDLAWERLRARLAGTAAELPAGTIGPHVDAEFGKVAVATLALTAPDYTNADMRREALALRDRLATLPGVERVTLHGLAPERVTVEVSPLALAQHGLSPSLLATILAAENILLPGGRVTAEGITAMLDAGRGLRGLDDIAALRVTLPNGGGSIALGEIATVRRGPVEPLETAAFHDGRRAVVFGISMAGGLDVRGFTRDLRARLPAVEATLPAGFSLAVLTDQGEVVADKVSGMGRTLLETVAVVALVVVLALGLRGGLVVAASAPLTMLVSLVVLRAMGVELNSVSIAAFIIALGILVDNANVVADEAARRMALGEVPKAAARAAGRTMTLPLLVASLTCILAFAPPLFTANLSAIYMRVLTVVMAVTLLVSWALALTATPLLAARLVRPAPGGEGWLFDRIGRGYGRVLDLVLARPVAFCVAMVALLAATFGAASTIPSAFLPHADRPQFQLRLEAQPGTDTDRMAALASDVSAWLADRRENPDIAGALAYVGEGGPRFIPSVAPPLPAPHRAFLVVNVVEGADPAAVTDRLRRSLATRFPELNAEPRLFSMGENETGMAMLRLSSHDTAALGAAAARLLDAMRAIPGVREARTDWDAAVWRMRVETDPAAARRIGVTAEDVARALAGATAGTEITALREADGAVPVLLRARAEERAMERLADLPVHPAAGGAPVPLGEVARLVRVPEPSSMAKRDGVPTVTVSGWHPALTAETLSRQALEAARPLGLPPDGQVVLGGEVEDGVEAGEAVFAALPACALAMLLLFFVQFNSLRRVLIVVAGVPFCLIGVIGILVAFRAPFDFLAILGLFALLGTIVSNAILVLEATDAELAAGRPLGEAVRAAARQRLRPIVVTQATTVLGLIPLMLSGEPLWYSFNLVVVGGLTAGTLVSLGLVPALAVLLLREAAARVPRLAQG